MNSSNLRNPKIYSAPKDKEKFVLPKWLKILSIFIVLSLALLYLVYLSPVFKIKKIDLQGSVGSELIQEIEKYRGQNIFTFDSKSLENALQDSFPIYTDIDISKGIPNILRVSAEEKIPKIIWETGGVRFLVDEKGMAYKKADGEQLPLVVDKSDLIIEKPTVVCTENFVKFVRDVNQKGQEKSLDFVSYEIEETIFQLKGLNKDNLKFIFDTTRPITDQFDALAKVYPERKEEIKEYIDLRVEGWVYFK